MSNPLNFEDIDKIINKLKVAIQGDSITFSLTALNLMNEFLKKKIKDIDEQSYINLMNNINDPKLIMLFNNYMEAQCIVYGGSMYSRILSKKGSMR